MVTTVGRHTTTKRVTSSDRSQEVRLAFEETVRPHSVTENG